MFTFNFYNMMSLITTEHSLNFPQHNVSCHHCMFPYTHVYMNLFTWNSPYYHLLKYLLFLLKHPVYKHGQSQMCRNLYVAETPISLALQGLVALRDIWLMTPLLLEVSNDCYQWCD
jgi:hypothetical protein